MPTLTIVEFASSVIWPTAGVPIALAPPVATQTVALGSTSLPSALFNGNTNIVRLYTDTNCAVQFSPIGTTTVTATATTSMPLAAFQAEYFGVQPNMRLAATTTS